MAAAYLDNPIFKDDAKAREYLEALRWPSGPECPHCGVVNQAKLLAGKSTRPGVYQCNACREPFTVTVGTVYERSKIALHKWLLATYLLSCSKKGMSSLQLMRMLGVTYKTAWFMTHRIREAMRVDAPTPVGGEGKTVEMDETYVGGLEKNKHLSKRVGHNAKGGKKPVFALVERGGEIRSTHVANVTAKTLRPIIAKHVSKASFLMTDEAQVYKGIGREFGAHEIVSHSKGEYVRGNVTTNTIESAFAILKRGVYGTYHSISEQHLHRYLSEFDFRYNGRTVTDAERTARALAGIGGKRLTYRQKPHQPQA